MAVFSFWSLRCLRNFKPFGRGIYFVLVSAALCLLSPASFAFSGSPSSENWKRAILSEQELSFLQDIRFDTLESIQEKQKSAQGLLDVLSRDSLMKISLSQTTDEKREIENLSQTELLLEGVKETNQRFRILSGLLNVAHLKKGILRFPPTYGLRAIELTPDERAQVFELDKLDRIEIARVQQLQGYEFALFDSLAKASHLGRLGQWENPKKALLLNQQRIFYLGQLKVLMAKFPYLFFLNSPNPSLDQIVSSIEKYSGVLMDLRQQFESESLDLKSLLYLQGAAKATAEKHKNKYPTEFTQHLFEKAYTDFDLAAWAQTNWMNVVSLSLTGCSFIAMILEQYVLSATCGALGIAMNARMALLSTLQFQMDEKLFFGGLKVLEDLQSSKGRMNTRYIFLGMAVFMNGATFLQANQTNLRVSLDFVGKIRSEGLPGLKEKMRSFLEMQAIDRARFLSIDRTSAAAATSANRSLDLISSLVTNLLAQLKPPVSIIPFRVFLQTI